MDAIWTINFGEMKKNTGLEVSGLPRYPLLSGLVITIDYRDGQIDLDYPAGSGR